MRPALAFSIGHRDQLLKELMQPPDKGDTSVGNVIMQHLEGADWNYFGIARYKSYQDYGANDSRHPPGSKPEAAAPNRVLAFRRRYPTHPENDGRFVILALVRVDRAAGVETENFVAEIQTGDYNFESPVKPVTALNIVLRVRV